MLGLQRRPRLVSRPSLFELITKKNIEDLSDLGFLQHNLGLPDLIEDIDEQPYSSRNFVSNFPVPIQAPHSTARTIRMRSRRAASVTRTRMALSSPSRALSSPQRT